MIIAQCVTAVQRPGHQKPSLAGEKRTLCRVEGELERSAQAVPLGVQDLCGPDSHRAVAAMGESAFNGGLIPNGELFAPAGESSRQCLVSSRDQSQPNHFTIPAATTAAMIPPIQPNTLIEGSNLAARKPGGPLMNE